MSTELEDLVEALRPVGRALVSVRRGRLGRGDIDEVEVRSAVLWSPQAPKTESDVEIRRWLYLQAEEALAIIARRGWQLLDVPNIELGGRLVREASKPHVIHECTCRDAGVSIELGELDVVVEAAVLEGIDRSGTEIIAAGAMRCPSCGATVKAVQAEISLADSAALLVGKVRLAQTRPTQVQLHPCGCRFDNIPGSGLRPASEVDPSLPSSTVELRDPDTGRVVGRIVNIGQESDS